MIYRFALLSREQEDFRMEVEISGQETFLALNNLIIQALGFSGEDITQFHIADDNWEPLIPVTMIERDVAADEDQYIMESTPIEELIHDKGDKAIFEFDILNGRGLYMSLRELRPGTTEPVVTMLRGTRPEPVKMDLFLDVSRMEQKKRGGDDDLDEEFYGTDDFNEDEFDQEGFSDLDLDDPNL